ncbi:hypothetical protein [Luteibacter sahnii]|uniref:hypothetical protein n=1 Tax=Luteibacter sahnii TaxID=3021977 RepID=UPI002A69CD92|nr:hypothetical protein [Luteibacter sp. PPL193]MDY1546807.1 hypothetical protein [Luteibacter sp. PPL193]
MSWSLPGATGSRLTVIFIVSTILILVAYAGLLPYGHWQPDEYQNIVAYRLDSAGFFWRRITTWSPRPASELLIYLYVRCVEFFRQPLIPWGLIPGWALLFTATLLPVFQQKSGVCLGAMLTQRLTLLCLFFLGHGVAELFYWPMAALAYLPTLAAIVTVYSLAESASSERPLERVATALALLVAATSTEVGAMFVMCHGAVDIACVYWQRRKPSGWIAICIAVPLLVAMVVLYRLAVGRVALNGETFGDARYIHHVLPSLLAAVPHALWETIASDSLSIDLRHLVTGSIIKLGFFSGCLALALRFARPSGVCRRLPVMLACFAMVPLTLAAAYYQFGMMACCERHASLRQCLILIGLSSLASTLVTSESLHRLFKRLRGHEAVACGCFGLALLAGLSLSQGRLREDYAMRESLIDSRRETWLSGNDARRSMTVFQTNPGRIVGGYPVFAPGRYGLDAHPVPEITTILQFFGKEGAIFTQPGESAPSGTRSGS